MTGQILSRLSEPIRIRGHHLENARQVHSIPRFDFTEDMQIHRYVQSSEHHFISLAYDLVKKLFSNPNQEFLVVVDELDFICEACPKLKTGECRPTTREQQEIVGRAFLQDADRDVKVIRQYGIESNKVYTAKEIRERMR